MPAKVHMADGTSYTIDGTVTEFTQKINGATGPLVPIHVWEQDKLVSLNPSAISHVEALPDDYKGPRVRVLTGR